MIHVSGDRIYVRSERSEESMAKFKSHTARGYFYYSYKTIDVTLHDRVCLLMPHHTYVSGQRSFHLNLTSNQSWSRATEGED